MDSLKRSPNTRILPATLDDLSIISSIAYNADLDARTILPVFIQGSSSPSPLSSVEAYFASSVRSKYDNPDGQVIKLIDTGSKEILAVVCLTRVSADRSGNDNTEAEILEGTDHNSAKPLIEVLERLADVMKGREHFILEKLAVVPTHQNFRLGTQLMRHCLNLADEAGLPIYLTPVPSAYEYYLRFGFKETGQFDMDLTKWAGKWRGYGIFRLRSMVREPEMRA